MVYSYLNQDLTQVKTLTQTFTNLSADLVMIMKLSTEISLARSL